jgi:hypothetical protein
MPGGSKQQAIEDVAGLWANYWLSERQEEAA